MSVFIVIKVMMVVAAISSFRVHTVRGTIRSAGCYGNPVYWANASEYWARTAYVGIANYISAPSVSHSRHCKPSDGASCTNISDDSSEGRREGRHVRLIQQQHTRHATRAVSVAAYAYAGLVLRRLG